MKTNIVNIHGMHVVKTGRIFVYEDYRAVYDEDGKYLGDEEYSYSEEIVDVCSGEHYGFNGLIHLIGTPVDSYVDHSGCNLKRGRHSNSNNKKATRSTIRGKIVNDLPF